MSSVKISLDFSCLKRIDEAAAEGINEALKPVFNESQILVPKDTLKLVNSVIFKQASPNDKKGAIAYHAIGDDGEDYAKTRHEIPMHRPTTPGTTHKYLEKPWLSRLEETKNKIAKKIGDSIGKK